ncbi:ankyrin repeat domain-containing protein [Dactylosporangium sp. NPDC049742]|uniref:ankyrin repeat domain-containing protein n=1 Tax=Dactylosporangium sp. NPDC049742 TaxID=3154737 RepID=UPI00343F7C47
MIEESTRLRLAGDWRGACAVANVAVELDLAAVADRHGADVAGRVADDLAHLVPDLLRWHLPLRPEPLNGARAVTPLALYEGGVGLTVHGPDVTDQPQRLRLRAEPVAAGHVEHGLHLNRERWDDRHTTELLARCGGRTRLPFFTAAGTPLPVAELGRDDHEGRSERATQLLAKGRIAAAWDEAGFDVDAPEHLLRHYRPGLTMLAERARHLAETTGGDVVLAPMPSFLGMLLDRLDGPRPRVRVVPTHNGPPAGVPALPRAAQHWPSVLDELRGGELDPAQLHPLVGAALFPARGTLLSARDSLLSARGFPTMPAPPRLPGPVELSCGGTWHQVAVRDGTLHVPHPPEELTRELALQALAGRVEPGCAVAVRGWRTAGGWLPTPLLKLRSQLLEYVMHGEATAVEALLDEGLDPRLLDAHGRTLVHLLPWLFPAGARLRVLDRLLAAGLDAGARDRLGRTPLHFAVRRGASPTLIRALLAAGADPAATDHAGQTPVDAAPTPAVARLLTGFSVVPPR